jgi:hypothetical protein
MNKTAFVHVPFAGWDLVSAQVCGTESLPPFHVSFAQLFVTWTLGITIGLLF